MGQAEGGVKQILGMRENYSRFMMGHTNHKDSAFMRDIVTLVFTYDKESSGKSPIAGFIYSQISQGHIGEKR